VGWGGKPLSSRASAKEDKGCPKKRSSPPCGPSPRDPGPTFGGFAHRAKQCARVYMSADKSASNRGIRVFQEALEWLKSGTGILHEGQVEITG
jgi:hypothetical protein